MANHQCSQLLILEEELIKLILEFLSSREYHVSLRTLERESNVINYDYADEVLFLRELVLDGDFDEVLVFGRSFTSNEGFDENKFNYVVLRQKFIELIYAKCHILGKQNIDTVGDVMKTLSRLEKYCTTKEDYNNLCWLLTVPDLNSHEDFKEWNLDASRLNCFNELLDCLNAFMPRVKRQLGINKTSSGNRLLQLIVKGLYYETCSEYCESTATNPQTNGAFPIKTGILDYSMENDFSSNLLSWIRSLPQEVFQFPFEMCDVGVCYSKINGKQIHYARDYLTKTFTKTSPNSEKTHKSLSRQTSEPSRKEMFNLGTSKSKSFDMYTPNILSSSLPVSTLKNGFHGNSHGTDSLQSSFTAGSRGLSKPIGKTLHTSGIHSANIISPALSSSGVDMSPVVTEQKPRLDAMRRSNEKIDLYRSSGDFEFIEASRYGLLNNDLAIRKSFEDFKTSLSYDEKIKYSGIRSAPEQRVNASTEYQKPEIVEFSNEPQFDEQKNVISNLSTMVTNDQVSRVNQTDDDESSASQAVSKPAIAFELFESKPPDKVQDEQKRREELFNKLKKHEQNRQESLKTLYMDPSPESISSRNPLSSSLQSDDPSIYSSNEKIHASGKRKITTKSDRSSPTLKNRNPLTDSTGMKDIDRKQQRMEIFSAETDNGNDLISKENSSPPDSNKARGPLINGVRRPPRPSQTPKSNEEDRSPPQKYRETIRTNAMSPEYEMKTLGDQRRTDNILSRSDSVVNYQPISMLEDSQAVRSVCFHPSGKLHAIGANSKILRICATDNKTVPGATVSSMSELIKKQKYHRGSIYCMSWDPEGRCLATGSNDKTIKVLQFDPQSYSQIGDEVELNIHAGTVRDLAFVPNRNGYLISGGAGSGSVNITDLSVQKVVGTFEGHSGNVLTVYVANVGELVATGGTDNTLRLWDLRSQRCIDVIVVGESSPASVSLSGGNEYVASGQEDGSILLYDISAGRTLHNIRLHKSDCRSVRFSPDSNYLMTSSYDATIALMHMRTNLEYNPPKHYVIAQHLDKVIQCRWHPSENILLSSSADRTAILWRASHF